MKIEKARGHRAAGRSASELCPPPARRPALGGGKKPRATGCSRGERSDSHERASERQEVDWTFRRSVSRVLRVAGGGSRKHACARAKREKKRPEASKGGCGAASSPHGTNTRTDPRTGRHKKERVTLLSRRATSLPGKRNASVYTRDTTDRCLHIYRRREDVRTNHCRGAWTHAFLSAVGPSLSTAGKAQERSSASGGFMQLTICRRSRRAPAGCTSARPSSRRSLRSRWSPPGTRPSPRRAPGTSRRKCQGVHT